MYRHPETAAMLKAVAAFLRDVCAPALSGREAFLAKVAANAVEIAAREAQDGPAALAAEIEALRGLVGDREGGVEALRTAVCEAIKAGARDETDPALMDALLSIAVDRVRIEQPNYASLGRIRSG